MNAKASGTIKANWQTFSDHLLAGVSATDSYLRAGYRSRSRASAQAAASRLLRHPRFAVYFDKLRRQACTKSRRRTIRILQRRLHFLKRIIQADASTVPCRDRSLIEYQKTFRHGGKTVRLPCKLTALRQYLKLTGALTPPPPSPPLFSQKHQQIITSPTFHGKPPSMTGNALASSATVHPAPPALLVGKDTFRITTPKMTKPKQPTTQSSAKASWLARSISRLFGKTNSSKPKKSEDAGVVAPAKAETALLPPFPGLAPDRIYVPHTAAECENAAQVILAAGIAGFDTEARPTFKAGEKSTGPHVVQFALTDRAFIFQLHRPDCQRIAAELIASHGILKVGFGLKNDHGQIRHRLGVTLHHVLDLDHVFKKRGHKNQIGVRRAMAEVLQLSFPKSKSTSTSNWAAPELSPRQLLYAANDAYAALKILEALNLDPNELILKSPPKSRRKKHTRSTDAQ